jgi:hypothetical protein
MHLHVYRDQARSGHVELVGDGEHPWMVDLVVVVTAVVLVLGFAAALAVHLVR